MFQKDVANLIGVDTNSVTNWEKNRSNPRLYLLPKVFAFLGYDPFRAHVTSLGGMIRQYRVQKGLSLRKFAKELGVDPATIARWEEGKSQPRGELIECLSTLLSHVLDCRGQNDV